MAIPSYAILAEQNNNIPSYAIPVDDSSAQQSTDSQGILGTALNAIKGAAENPIDTINAAGGAVGRGLEYGVAGLVNLPINAANYLNQKLAGAFGVQPQNVPTPETINPQSIPMPFVSQQTQQMLDPIAKNVANAALLATPIIGGAKLGLMGGRAALNKLYTITGSNADVKANDFISSLLGNNSFSKSHIPVLNELRTNYDTVQTASNKQYDNILNQAAQQGYTGGKQFPGISMATGEKTIIPNNFQNELSGIDLSQYSKDIKDLLEPFNKSVNNNLSFNEAHDLQSKVGNNGAKLVTSPDGMQRYLGKELLGLRDTLKDDITGSLLANGDKDLANQYQNASDFFKNNVAPYRENSTIRNVVMKSGLKEVNPANIGNVLKKEDGSILPIVNQLSPESKNLLLANQLKGATQELPEAGQLQRGTNAQALVKAYGKLDNKGFANLRSPESIQAIQAIQNALSKQNYIKRIGIALGLTGVGAGALEGYQQLRKIL